MSTVSESSKIVSTETIQPQPTHLNDLSIIQPFYRLNGRNYLTWSQVIRTKLKGKGKLHHLTKQGPDSDDPKFEAWDIEDSLIMSWLWDSMQPEISGNCMFLATAKEIWETVKRTYSKVKDAALVFETKSKIHSTKQGTLSVTDYYNTLNGLWVELDYYHNIKMKCSEDAAILLRFIEGERIYEFLAGLNIEYDPVRIQILGKEELPSISEVFAIIRGEEGRRSVMVEFPKPERSALLTNNQTPYQPKQNSHDPSKNNKDDLWCNYCKKPGHTKETCWKLKGKPPFRRNNNWNTTGLNQLNKKPLNKQAHTAAANEITDQKDQLELSALNKEEVEKIRSLLTTIDKPVGSCSLAHAGNYYTQAFTVSLDSNHSEAWVVDSGATDHMTNSSHQFSTYTPCSGHQKIRVADGTLAPIAGKGTISITPFLTLESVLHVPKLSINLLSIPKLTKDLNC